MWCFFINLLQFRRRNAEILQKGRTKMKTKDFRLSWTFLYVSMKLMISVKANCQFPETWSGKWFQSERSIEVNLTHIESKGVCLETDGIDRFLLEDRVENCFRCLVMHQKHYNVLQYKETYCFSKKKSLELCEEINGDAPLFSMFRLNAKPTSCPFKGGPPFTFTYNRGSGECKSPVSKSDSCTDDSRMLLRYQACADVRTSESTVEELTCLASWRDGSTKYMVGKLEHKMASTDEDRYRCFVWSQQDHVYYVAQSGDATCNGLPSSTEGSRTMKLMRADTTTSHHQNANCKFPSWLTDHHSWHPLDHSKTYHFGSHNGTLSVSSVRDNEHVLEMRAVCNSIIQNTDSHIMIAAHITIGCESGYRCMTFYKRDTHVIEVQQSNREFQNSDEACSNQEIDQQTLPFITLITPLLKKRRCPFVGRYTVSNNNDLWKLAASTNHQQLSSSNNYPEEKIPCENGKQILSLGCNSVDTMEFHSECNSDITAAYSCHGDWVDSNGTSYMIALPDGDLTSGSGDKFCFVIYNLPDSTGGGGGSDLSRRARRLQLHSLTKSCRRDVHLDNSDPHWMFNITHHADCDGSFSGISSRRECYKYMLLLMLALTVYVFRSSSYISR